MASRKTRVVGAVGAVAIAMVGTFEGLRRTVYLDPVGIPTVCFGSTKDLTRQMVGKVSYSREECEALLVEELKSHEAGMRKCLARPDELTDGQYVAFLSFTFNVGVGAFCKSTLVKKANAGDFKGACAELSRWDRARGIRLPGLVKRRAEERRICEQGIA